MRPYFEVGEDVIIQSNTKPELNGQVHTVSHILDIDSSGTYTCPVTNSHVFFAYYTKGMTAYYVDGLSVTLDDDLVKPCLVRQVSLRKIYKGGGTLESLLESLDTRNEPYYEEC